MGYRPLDGLSKNAAQNPKIKPSIYAEIHANAVHV